MDANKILLTGSSGLIGNPLVRMLGRNRISALILRRQKSAGTGPVWNPYAAQPVSDLQALQGISAAVHLSGANVGKRWTPAYKQEIIDSRVTPTRALAAVLAGLQPKPAVMICASAIGIYGGRGEEILTEASTPGSGFLADVCRRWEEASQLASEAGIRVVHLRFGVVLSPDGGALAQMLPVFRAGLGGKLGSGRQWLSWVALPDVIRAILFAIDTPGLAGPVNVVSPHPVRNLEFTRVLARVLHRPAVLPAPAVGLRMVFGEMAQETILDSARVLPDRLQTAGFRFDYPQLEDGLRGVLLSGRQ